MFVYAHRADASDHASGHKFRRRATDASLVLLVKDHPETLAEMKQVLEGGGYRVIDADNGQDASRRASYAHPDLVLIDLGVPLLSELATARQIVQEAQLGPVPVVVVTQREELEPYPIVEVNVRSNEYVTRLSDYEQLEYLLHYLLPVRPKAA